MLDLTEEKISSETIYDGTLLHVRKDTVRLPNSKTSTREYLVHQGAVCIVPVTDAGKVIMERQYRYPFHQLILEAPAGKRDPGEDWLAAAKRELQEETGISAAQWVDLGDFFPSVAYTNESIRLYMARCLSYSQQHMDEDEFLELVTVPLEELKAQVLSGDIRDGKTQVAILKVWHYLNG